MDDTSIPDLSLEEARKARRREQARARHAANPLPRRASYKRWHTKHHEERLAKQRADRTACKELTGTTCHTSQQRYRERNRALLVRKAVLYYQEHPDKLRERDERRRAREAKAPINDFDEQQFRAMCKAAGYRCAYCHKKFPFKKLTKDHLTPYADEGSNTLHNILPCCLSCNSKKGDRDVLKPVQPFLLLDKGAAD